EMNGWFTPAERQCAAAPVFPPAGRPPIERPGEHRLAAPSRLLTSSHERCGPLVAYRSLLWAAGLVM
ncbi:MAG: hypothetical protein ACPIOQ_46055, partial [Promethearchaeia archaeon]